jgi:predicted transposase/invertase (TIGR01784 family)
MQRLDNKSRMSGDVHVRFRERLEGKFLWATRLVKVYRKGGESIILLVHLEVQAEPEIEFPKRMFVYMIRIFEYFDQEPISLAILCDSDTTWRPNQYSFVTTGSALQFDFTAVKLLDYRSQWDELEANGNIFATVVMTQLKAQDTKRNEADRKQWKLTLIKRLYERGYDRSRILNLFAFVDWIMILSGDAKLSFWQELRTYEEERQMPYITSVEQIGYDRGIEEKAIAIALNMLRKNLDVETIAEVTGLSIDQIQSLQGQMN